MACTIESPEDNGIPNFHLFPHLPTELRLQIWEDAVLSRIPRVVLLEPKQLSSKCNKDGPAAPRWGFRSYCPIPGLLVACRESFGVASKYYQRSFGTENAFPQTWFDFERDYLYLKVPWWRDPNGPERQLDYSAMMYILSQEERRKIQRLVLGDYYELLIRPRGIRSQEFAMYEAIKAFDRVKEMYLVYFEGWTAEDLEKETQLILGKFRDAERISDLFEAPDRRTKYCACFNEMADQWEQGRRRPMWYISRYFGQNVAIPEIMGTMVFTPHLNRVFSEAMKQWERSNSEL